MEKTTAFVDGIQKVATDTQDKAKEAFKKGTELFGEAADFTKGNVEAFVASGKIFATGVQEMSNSLVNEGKTAFEAATADFKDLAAAKSPNDFVKLHSDIMRRNLDSVVALSSKNGEAMLKLASDTFAPISSRISLAVDKVRKAA